MRPAVFRFFPVPMKTAFIIGSLLSLAPLPLRLLAQTVPPTSAPTTTSGQQAARSFSLTFFFRLVS